MIAIKCGLGSNVSKARRSVLGPRLSPVHDGAVAVCGISLRGDEPPSDFGRLILMVRSNEHYLGQLDALNVRISQAKAQLDNARDEARVRRVYLAHLKTKRSGVLAQLRANRIEAEQILDPPDSRD